MVDVDRPPAARLHRRQAADARVNVELETEGMTLNIGPQHPATHGTLRIVVKLDGEQVVACRADHGLHAPGLREAHRGPHLPAGHHAHQPHRLAGQLRQRGAVHPRRRAAHGGRGPAPGAVDPHDPLRDEPHRQHLAVPRRHGRAARRAHAGLLRLPRPRARPQPDRGGHRRALPPQLRPHRRPQGRPAQGLDRRDQGRAWRRSATSATRWRTSSSATRSSRPAPAASASSPPTSPSATACRAPTSGPAASTGTSAATTRPRPGLGQGRLEGLDPPRRRLLRPLLGAPPGDPRGDQDRRPAARRPARAGRSWPRCPASSRCPPARRGSAPRTRSARWATTSSARATSGRSGCKIRTPSFNNISVVPWVLRGVYVPDVITILASLYFILGDIDR